MQLLYGKKNAQIYFVFHSIFTQLAALYILFINNLHIYVRYKFLLWNGKKK